MEPAQTETADVLSRLRQQLILAEVRIMELQDVRDDTAGHLTEIESLLKAAQTIADHKIEEAAHLTQVHSDLQAQFENLRHIQHLTNQALNQTRAELATVRQQEQTLRSELSQTQAQVPLLQGELAQKLTEIARLNTEATASAARESDLRATVAGLEAELTGMKATFSWRWTAWLRATGRFFGADSP